MLNNPAKKFSLMNALFFAMLTLFLILVQTILFPSFPWFSQSFDLLIIDVICLSLVYSHYAVILAIAVIGCIMDSLSGVAFFHHIFAYLWIYLIVILFKQLVFQRSVIFVLIISLVSVLIQQAMILFSVFIEEGRDVLGQTDFSLMAKQLFWGGVVIPPSVWAINGFRQYWLLLVKRLKKQFTQKYRG